MNQDGPSGIRKTIHLVIVLSMLALATQLLLHQWGYGAVARADEATESPVAAKEKFVPGTPRFLSGATLELRGEATIVGSEVKLKQICRWADADKAAFEPVADFIVARMGASVSFRMMTLPELKTTLQDAGVNLAVIRFAGTTSCTISRSDVAADERASLQEWVNAQRGPTTREAVKASSVLAPTTAATQSAKPQAEAKVNRSLRELLVADLAERLSLEPTAFQMKFNPVDERLLNLSEPLFRFNVDGQRARGLGSVSWDVTIVADSGNQKTTINAVARAWQEQLIVLKPMAYHQTIRNEDLTDRRALVDQLSGEATLKREQAVGQMAGRELQAGTILTPRLVEASPLVKTGQLVTVTVEQGRVQITSAARAMETGSYGQVIRVKNDATGNTFEVTITGPQAAKMSVVAREGPAAVAGNGN